VSTIDNKYITIYLNVYNCIAIKMDNFFTIKQVAFILKVHQLTVRRYVREKRLAAVKIAGLVRIKEKDLQNFQKEYFAREKSATTATPEAPKNFSTSDPLWLLNGKGGSLSLPTDYEK